MKNIKQVFLLFSFMATSSSHGLGQENVLGKARSNTVFLEVLGNAYLYSFNYERVLLSASKMSYSARAGVSYFNVLNSGWMGDGLKYKFFPVTLNAVRHFDKNNIELGLGLTNEISNDEADQSKYNFVPTLHTGYRRYMENNFDFRAGVNLSRANLSRDDNREVLPWPYLSFGMRF